MRPLSIILVSFCLFLASSVVTAAETVTLPNCLLSLDAEVLMPAQEAGVLMKIPVHEGQQVSKGDLLAQIDDTLPRLQQNVAMHKLKAAQREAEDDVSIRYSTAAARVAEARVTNALAANKKVPGVIPDEELRERQLKQREMELSIEKAQKEKDVAGLQAKVNEAELQAAAANLERRRLIAPLDAVVIELTHHEGEWVQPGDPVMRLVRVDLLRVEGFLNVKNYRPSEIQGRPVEVSVTLARGKKESFPGRIVYVKPLIEAGGEFLVRAEVENRQENGFWILSPGLKAEMTIQLK